MGKCLPTRSALASDRRGQGLIGALVAAAALITIGYGIMELLLNQKRGLVYQEARTSFIQGRFSVGELVRTHGPELCAELGFAPAPGAANPTPPQAPTRESARQLARELERNPSAERPPLFEKKQLLDARFAQSRDLASIRQVLPSGLQPFFEVDPTTYECTPDRDNSAREKCTSFLNFKVDEIQGRKVSVGDRFQISLNVEISPERGRAIASCELGESKASAPEEMDHERGGMIPLGAQDFDLGGDFTRVTFLGHVAQGDAAPMGGFITRQADNTMRALITALGNYYADFVLDSVYRCIWTDGKTYENRNDSPVCLRVNEQSHVLVRLGPTVRTAFVAQGLQAAPSPIATPARVEPVMLSFSCERCRSVSGGGDCGDGITRIQDNYCQKKCPAGKKLFAPSLNGHEFARVLPTEDGILCPGFTDGGRSGGWWGTCSGVCY